MISIRDLTNRSEVHVARASIISSGITAQPPQYASERKFTSVGQERLRTGLIGSENCELELRWLKDHRAQFAGQWVALQGYRLIAHGTDPREVYESARRMGIDVPFLERVEPVEEQPFAGW